MKCPADGHECNNPLAISIVEITDGYKREITACHSCPFKKDPFLSLLLPVEFKLFHEPVDNVECKCGMTFFQLTKNGRLGCTECYKTFSDFILPVIEKNCKTTKHVGKFPKLFRNKNEVESLKKEMEEAIKAENYERCAEIRDRLKDMQNEKN